LYRNHLKNRTTYEEFGRAKDKLSDLSDRLERAQRATDAIIRKEIQDTRRLIIITLDDGTPLKGIVHFMRAPPEDLTEIGGILISSAEYVDFRQKIASFST
jgi:hypothetical protein